MYVCMSMGVVGSTGVAQSLHGMNCEDTITLSVQWENISIASDDTGASTIVVTGLGRSTILSYSCSIFHAEKPSCYHVFVLSSAVH